MVTSTRIGTGRNQNRFGRVNQRAAISAWASGVQMLTIPITASTPNASGLARLCICSCNLPSVFMISQVQPRSEEHTSELQSLMRISYAVFCFKKKKQKTQLIQRHALDTQQQK